MLRPQSSLAFFILSLATIVCPIALIAQNAATPPLSRNLELRADRMHGNDVLAAQKRLLELGYAELGEADGWLGPKSEQAIARFRHRNGPSEGRSIDGETWDLLFLDASMLVRGESPRDESRSLVAIKGLILGSLQPDGSWLGPEDTAKRIDQAPVSVRVQAGSGTWVSALGEIRWPGTLALPYFTTPLFEIPGIEEYQVAIRAAFEPLPRPIRDGQALPKPAASTLASYIAKKGMPVDGSVSALSLDWDGDGRLDYLATVKGAGTGEDGREYSAVLLVSPAKAGGFELVELAGYWRSSTDSTPERHDFAVEGLLDADGDGSFEAVLSEWVIDGLGYQLIKLQAGKLRILCSAGMGA